ncbi:MAG: two-component system response regulator OmpR [Zoogloeaceae bacterium]|jgi:two-component system OmpR family response regulator/two-component system phosphate regulon response regulator OmpR|nr:two-component system response regulator OmpR [Zoogloeaceae bacterium]
MPKRSQRLLIIDDDTRTRELLQRYLQEQEFEVRAAPDSKQMDKYLQREHFDLLILDLMLPGEDGLSVCRRLRAHGNNIPIIMLTAKGSEIDRILGLEMGADDYLPKPFNPRELYARIQAVLRRPSRRSGGLSEEPGKVTFGGMEVDFSARTLTKPDGKTCNLTTGEFAVLSALLRNPRQPLSRDQLMTLTRGREQGPFDRAIDVQISRLRKLVEPNSAQPRYLQTVWGLGYMFVPDDAEVTKVPENG